MFDGVHLGHQRVLGVAAAAAADCGGLCVAITFDRHPRAVLTPAEAPPLIQSPRDKQAALRLAGADACLVIAFDEAFSRLSAPDFVGYLATGLRPLHSVCVGTEFVFGHRRSGNVEVLREQGSRLGFETRAVPPVVYEGEPISSTRIRQAVQEGNLAAAAAMLGRPYAFTGVVVTGDRLGRKLGFPTANLETTAPPLAPHGVYAAEAVLDETRVPAVLNVGHRPTLNRASPPLRVEAHLLDYTGDLYGRELEVIPRVKLREERRFASMEALQAAIGEDIRAARAWFATQAPKRD